MSANVVARDAQSVVTVGKIGAPYGVRGWLKVQSFTDPVIGILNYQGWLLVQQGKLTERVVAEGKPHGKGLVIRLEGIDDRDAAAMLTGAQIQVARESLPQLDEGFYWMDLIGMNVEDQQGTAFGQVASMMETGANDVLVVKGDRERLIPWVMEDVILNVDQENGKIVVDWDPDF